MAIIAMDTELDVLNRYTKLMQTSMGSESLYARTKETLDVTFKQYNINAVDRATVLSQVLSNLSTSLSTSSMDTALRWATAEKDLYLRKLEAGRNLDILDNQIKESAAAADKMAYDSIAVQAETIRMMGTPSVVDGKVISLEDSGKVWQDIQVSKVQQVNLDKEGNLLDSRLKESYSAIHKTVADTVTNLGAWTYSVGENGISTAPTQTPILGNTPLSDIQKIIAQEQAKGYSFNAWSNAVTASAGMIGTVVASDGVPPETLLTSFQTIVDRLGAVVQPTF